MPEYEIDAALLSGRWYANTAKAELQQLLGRFPGWRSAPLHKPDLLPGTQKCCFGDFGSLPDSRVTKIDDALQIEAVSAEGARSHQKILLVLSKGGVDLLRRVQSWYTLGIPPATEARCTSPA